MHLLFHGVLTPHSYPPLLPLTSPSPPPSLRLQLLAYTRRHTHAVSLFTVENTDPECFWLCTWFETLLVQCWYPLTVASLSRAQKITLKTYMKHTADDEAMAGLGFKLHDFGFRGATCAEAAGIGGAAHLVNFMGSDTVAALTMARDTYGLDSSTVAVRTPIPPAFPFFFPSCSGLNLLERTL